MAPAVGFEPTTLRLTAGCSTVELCRNEVVGDPGFEPGLPDPESGGLPLPQSPASLTRDPGIVITGAARQEISSGSDLFSPFRSTFGPGGLNFRVRYGNG